MSIQRETTGGTGSFVDGLNDAVRENPVSAALVGMGVLWMVFGGKTPNFGGIFPAVGRGLAVAGETAKDGAAAVGGTIAATANRVSELAQSAGNTVASGVRSGGSMIRDVAQERASSLKQEASSLSEDAADAAGKASGVFDDLRTSGGSAVMGLQKNLRETFEKQPLLLGVVGAAIGAGIAAAFASTKLESRVLGESSAAVREQLSDAAEEIRSRAGQFAEDIQDEASQRGFTANSAKEQLKSVANKASNVANATRDSVKNRVSGH